MGEDLELVKKGGPRGGAKIVMWGNKAQHVTLSRDGSPFSTLSKTFLLPSAMIVVFVVLRI